jgi:hypothetical protein
MLRLFFVGTGEAEPHHAFSSRPAGKSPVFVETYL